MVLFIIFVNVNKELKSGTYEVEWDARQAEGIGMNFPSEVYYYKLQPEDASASLGMTPTRKMVLTR